MKQSITATTGVGKNGTRLLVTTTQQQTREQPRVKRFLESIERNSKQSGHIYCNGLSQLQDFLNHKSYIPKHYTLENIIEPLLNGKVDAYELFDTFLSFLDSRRLSSNTIRIYLQGCKSYLQYNGFEIKPYIFKARVKLPKSGWDIEEALEPADIRKLLLNCTNRRLKAYLFTLLSGCRASEALSLSRADCNFTAKPATIHIKPENTKTRLGRTAFISDEAADYLKYQWLDWRDSRRQKSKKNKNKQELHDLIFSSYTSGKKPSIANLYVRLNNEFDRLLDTCGFDAKKDGMNRRKYTLHSIRRFVKTVAADQVNTDWSEYMIGHRGSTYWRKKQHELAQIYREKVMPYLTFLDYSSLESHGKGIDAQLAEKDEQIAKLQEREYDNLKEIERLKQRDTMNTDAMASLSDQVHELKDLPSIVAALKEEVKELKANRQQNKSELPIKK